MKKIALTTLAAVMATSGAIPAIAAQQGKGNHGGPRVERMMERFDTNRDGAVVLDEISAHRAAMFESVDADNSGSLNEEELAMLKDLRKAERKQAREDFRAKRKQARQERHAGRKGDRDDMRGKGRHGGPTLERLDTDGNGEISSAEFAEMETRIFERFDRNGDQKIDVTDFYRNVTNDN